MELHDNHNSETEKKNAQMKIMIEYLDSEVFFNCQLLMTLLCGKLLLDSRHAGFLGTQGGTLDGASSRHNLEGG
jgi:hypothetical protein